MVFVAQFKLVSMKITFVKSDVHYYFHTTLHIRMTMSVDIMT